MDVLAVIKAVRDRRTRPQWRRRNAYRSCDIPFPSAFLSDDASKYRTKEEEGEWNEKDPIARLAKYLEAKGLWTEEDTARVKEEAKAKVNEQIKKQNKRKMTVPGLIDSMFEQTPKHLEEQKADFQ